MWYSHSIVAFKVKHTINLNAEPSEEDFKILGNPDTSKLMIKLNHHLLGILYYHGDRIYGPWSKPIWGSPIPLPYNNNSSYVFGTMFRRRGKNAMPAPTKWAIYGFIDKALAGPPNT